MLSTSDGRLRPCFLAARRAAAFWLGESVLRALGFFGFGRSHGAFFAGLFLLAGFFFTVDFLTVDFVAAGFFVAGRWATAFADAGRWAAVFFDAVVFFAAGFFAEVLLAVVMEPSPGAHFR